MDHILLTGGSSFFDTAVGSVAARCITTFSTKAATLGNTLIGKRNYVMTDTDDRLSLVVGNSCQRRDPSR